MFMLVGLILVASVFTARGDTYTSRWDNVDVEKILKNERLLRTYFRCVMDQGKCSPDAAELKKNIPEAMQSLCAKCTAKQKASVDKVMTYLYEKRHDLYSQLEKKYDPDGAYRRKYKETKEAAMARKESKEADPVTVTESAKETVPVQVTESVKETVPVQVTESVKETVPVQITESVKDADPVKVTESVNEADPVNVTETEKEADPSNITESVKEAYPVKVTESVKEAYPVKVTESVKVTDSLPRKKSANGNEGGAAETVQILHSEKEMELARQEEIMKETKKVDATEPAEVQEPTEAA